MQKSCIRLHPTGLGKKTGAAATLDNERRATCRMRSDIPDRSTRYECLFILYGATTERQGTAM